MWHPMQNATRLGAVDRGALGWMLTDYEVHPLKLGVTLSTFLVLHLAGLGDWGWLDRKPTREKNGHRASTSCNIQRECTPVRWRGLSRRRKREDLEKPSDEEL